MHKVRTESELERKNQEIARILESTTDGFYALNRNWEVTYFNKAAERVLAGISGIFFRVPGRAGFTPSMSG